MRRHRTTLLFALVFLAVILPCAAWYALGLRSATREAAQHVDLVKLRVEQTASRLAERVATRLEALRSAESRRPAHHYRAEYIDPASQCDCAVTRPSLLAAGASDDLILSYFEMAPDGRVALPGDPGQADVPNSCWELRDHLESDYRDYFELVSARRTAHPLPGVAQAAAIWSDGARQERVIRVEPLRWVEIEFGGSPVLTAVRHCEEASGQYLQGFFIDGVTVQRLFHDSRFPAELIHGTWAGRGDDEIGSAPVPIEGLNWIVRVDASEAVRLASLTGDQSIARFHRTFGFVGGATLLVACAVVLLLWHTDRVSHERARFAASAAHELKTPLAGLRLYSDMLAKGLGDAEKSAEYASHISSEADRLGRVVTNVLNYSQIERDGLRLSPQRADLAGAVRECAAKIQPALEAAGAKLRLRLEGAAPALFDRDALFQILQNLIDNAEKYSRDSDDRTIDVLVEDADRTVALSVIDHGPGIVPSERRRMFGAFQRGERETPEGLGLGLMLVRNLVRAQSGRIRYGDAPGGGAMFTVEFPK
ncbi:MAG: HAMP domain-containing histidine kinase [Gemmatimonadetes bacterium]|nr:HAMP domain-containing histidine kinase [Gemmatimonadota bacterium]